MASLSKAFEREMRALGSIKNAKGYSAWLGTRATAAKAAADSARATNATKGTRLSVDYGTSGEALARGGLADDGYAAYLREAAKQQREARIASLEGQRAAETTQALAGYRDYLLGLRRADEERLIDAAQEVVALERDRLPELSRILDAADTNVRQKRALTYLYRNASTGGRSEENASTLRFLFENHYSYDRAYEYCLMIGIDPGLAHRMATASDEALNSNWDKVYDLFGDVIDP